jgi:S1-C subfamily serine protease
MVLHAMRRATLYSNAKPLREPPRPEIPVAPVAPVAPRRKLKWRHGYTAAILLAALGILAFRPLPPALTQKDIDAAVQRTLAEQVLPSPATKAYEAVRGSIVRVRAIGDGLEQDEYLQRAVGSGVVIVDKGIILTNLHVIAGAGRVRVAFADGMESDAKVVSEHPEQDLAVLQAAVIPDDLKAALVRPAADLRPGDAVVAVGFPFGIGPSVSAGVVSGLKRQYRAPHGERPLSDLIQFDAAVNPGSSGGPLVNAAGEVVGIVTAMLDPGGGGFAGIGFAVPIETARAAAGSAPF